MTAGESSDLERFKIIISTVALEHRDMPALDAFRLALEIEEELEQKMREGLLSVARVPGPDASTEELARYAYRTPGIWHFMPDRKINAIKELRLKTRTGLKEAKEAIEWAQVNLT